MYKVIKDIDISPSRALNGVLFLRILVRVGLVFMAPHWIMIDLPHAKINFLYFMHRKISHIQFGTNELTSNNDRLLYSVTTAVLQLYEFECF